MKAYRLQCLKDGSIPVEAENYLWDVDEDFTSKVEYTKAARTYVKEAFKYTGIKVSWQEAFGLPKSYDYRYCKKHDIYYYESDGCPECENY